nr:multiheme c-type cytochrome [uncultured Sulfurimonas sp.]
MKFILLSIVLFISASANNAVHTYAKSEECKACHTKIYDEYYGSMHANSTPSKDPIHKAVWDRHAQNLNEGRYACGKCHTPTADNLDKMTTKGQKVLPDANNETHQEGISCAYCHRIKSIELHKVTNTNIMTNTEKNYFGTMAEHMESPFHGITSEGNEHMQNGNVCIGCHSHKKNKHGLNVCSTNINNELDGANCVSCHMPKVDGSVSVLHETKKHAFHGFAGSHFHSEMLTKHVNISLLREINSFKVNVDNQTSHALLLHPMRMAVLKVKVIRDAKTINLKDEVFVRIIGADGKPAMPWLAKEDIKNTMIKANEKRVVEYDFKLQKGDKVEVVLGWFLVAPKALKGLGLEKEEVATKFNIFQKRTFNF